MRTALLVILTVSATHLFGQNGFVVLNNDSTLTGFLKPYISVNDGHRGIEFWRTKKDKSPRRIPKSNIAAYAIKKDTFKVLHQFKPFHDDETYFELVEAKRLSKGKVNLYIIDNYQSAAMKVYSSAGGGVIPTVVFMSLGNYSFIYILEDEKFGIVRALPSEKGTLKETLAEFLPERYITKYGEVKGKVNYRHVPDMITLYNSK